jgi:hypothetical protein
MVPTTTHTGRVYEIEFWLELPHIPLLQVAVDAYRLYGSFLY